jgi:hypothetical protein
MSHSAAILLRQLFVVLLLALVEAAVLQQHHLAGRDLHAIDPAGNQRHLAAEQFAHACSHRRQGILGLELALGRPAQVRSDHHRGAGLQRLLDAGHAGADSGVLGDLAGIVLRHVQVGTDEDTLTRHLAGGDEIGKTKNVHDETQELMIR